MSPPFAGYPGDDTRLPTFDQGFKFLFFFLFGITCLLFIRALLVICGVVPKSPVEGTRNQYHNDHTAYGTMNHAGSGVTDNGHHSHNHGDHHHHHHHHNDPGHDHHHHHHDFSSAGIDHSAAPASNDAGGGHSH